MFFKSHGLLWQNARNLHYIKGASFLDSKKIADSKLGTKKFLSAHNVAVPETLAIIKKHTEVDPMLIKNYETPFVVKPNNWYGWKWILIVESQNALGHFVTNTGEIFTPKEMAEHFIYILDGFFSLSWGRDTVLIEKKIILTKEIELFGTFGLPDIRIIAYNMVPVMAMMRIPTKESGWKANIHGWACAVGIDIGTWKLTYISSKGKTVKTIPGIGDVRWIVVPEWDKILSLAIQVQKVTGIKFLWCDVVLDEVSWPLLLEINIRPGLEIQNVNLAPLRTRLDKVEGVDISSVEKWVRLWRDLFSWDIEDKITELSGKKVVWAREYVKIIHNEKTYNYIADINIGKSENKIDTSFVVDILKIPLWEKTKLRLECEILWIPQMLRFELSDLQGEKMLLGRSSLKGFLIDPFKYKKGENPFLQNTRNLTASNTAITKIHQSQLLALDTRLVAIDKKMLLLKYVTPLNLDEQKQIFVEKQGDYTPKFTYREVPLDLAALKKELKSIEIPDIPLAQIYQKKAKEIENKINFLIAFKEQNHGDMTLYSQKVFGDIVQENFERSKERISARDNIREEEEFIEYEDIRDYMKKFNHIYGIKVKMKESESTSRFSMKWDILQFKKDAIVGKREMRSIIAHEIEGHYLRKINGRKSQFKILASGTAWYLETDEWIAIYNQNRFLTPYDKKYYSIFERYYFVQFALKHSYKKLVVHLAEFYDDDWGRVFNFMLRLKRWFQDPSKSGVFMKDVVYVNGLFWVEDYLENGWELGDLYIWKIGIKDIPSLEKNNYFTEHKKEVTIPFSL